MKERETMLFCYGCGTKISAAARACPQCGAPQKPATTATAAVSAPPTEPLPPGIKGWSWGAFLLSGIWAIGNRTWIGLLAFVPVVGMVIPIVLGIKGREWAWRNRSWESIEHFNAVQRKWTQWGVCALAALVVLGIIGGVGYGMYEQHQSQLGQQAEENEESAGAPQDQAESEPVSVSKDGTATYSDGTTLNPSDVECEEGICDNRKEPGDPVPGSEESPSP